MRRKEGGRERGWNGGEEKFERGREDRRGGVQRFMEA